MSLSIRWLPRFTLVSQMFITVRERLKVLWPRIYRQRFALLVMMFASGIKASLTSARCVARLVIVLRTVPLMMCRKCVARQPPVSAPTANSVPSVPDSLPPFNACSCFQYRSFYVYWGWGVRPGFRLSLCLWAWLLLWWRRRRGSVSVILHGYPRL